MNLQYLDPEWKREELTARTTVDIFATQFASMVFVVTTSKATAHKAGALHG